MADSAAEQKEAEEQLPEVSKDEITSVTEVLQAIIKTSKAYRMYLSNNPLLQRFLEELKARLANHLEEYGEIKLDIDQFDLKYKGRGIYQNREPKESLAFRMFSDGIRSLILSEGIDDREVTEFLDIVGKERASDVDDDIVTLLWIKDLPHIAYILAEDYLEFDSGGDMSASSAPQQENIKGLYKSIPPAPEKAPTPMLIPQSIISLSEEEIAWLKKAREFDENRSALSEVAQVLVAILSVEKDIVVFADFVDITVGIIENLLHSGDIHYALILKKFLKELSKNQLLPQENREKLLKSVEVPVSDALIKDLAGIMDSTDKVNAENLRDLLMLMGSNGIRQICELLGRVQKFDMRKVIIDVLVELGKDSPEAFFPFLSDKRWYLVRNAVIILRRIGKPAYLEHVGKLALHKEPRVRKEVLLSLGEFKDPKAKSYVLRFLQDDISAMRIHALKDLAKSGYQGALKPVLEIVSSKEFEERELEEKKAFYEALGELGADEAVPVLKDMLIKKYWFNKDKEKESVILAVSGLRKVKTNAALKAMEEAVLLKKDDIKTVIAQAIRGMEMDRARMETK